MRMANGCAKLVSRTSRFVLTLLTALVWLIRGAAVADDWPRWRGNDGLAISDGHKLPVHWNATQNVLWRVPIEGTGYSSPIVFGKRVYLTSSLDQGGVRNLWCLDRHAGGTVWRRTVDDDYPEISSAITGHAAATPVIDGSRIVAFFGNAGVICFDTGGNQLWKRDLGYFDTELGLATSPIVDDGKVYLVCDHDGNRFRSFDSFVIALDLATGKTVWKTLRPDLFRSWSTPIVVTLVSGKRELVVNAQDELRAYDAGTGELLWHVGGMTGWVTPSPVYGNGLIFGSSGRDGPTLAVRPGGRGDVTITHVAWRVTRGSPYVCSPLFYRDLLYVHNEQGILTCYRAESGEVVYRQRLEGKFTASGGAGDGKVYLVNEEGTTLVIAAGDRFELLAKNPVGEFTLASPAISGGDLFLRTQKHLWCIRDGLADR
jgi:outer membrane protein assembly factor BamB